MKHTLPEEQRTQDIESVTWMIFFGQNNFKLISVRNMIQVIDSIPWIRCASGNVFFQFFSSSIFLYFFSTFFNFFSSTFSDFFLNFFSTFFLQFFQILFNLWHLRHWLQHWQLRTWNHDNLCYLTINCDTGQHSQF